MTTALQSVPADESDSHPFSLFEGDLVSRIFARFGMGTYRGWDLAKRSILLVSVTCMLALLAIVAEVHWVRPPGRIFLWILPLMASC